MTANNRYPRLVDHKSTKPSMPKKDFGVKPQVAAAREREANKKEADKQSKKKAAEDALWADEANNKHALKQAELEKKKQAEAEKRALLKSLEAQENAELEKKRPPTKITAASIQKIRSQEEINAYKAKQMAEAAKKRITQQPDYFNMENPNMKKVDIEASEAAGKSVLVAHTLESAIEQLHVNHGVGDDHPERRLKAAYAAFEEREMPLLRSENPSLKYSQLKERLWEMFQKSPDNPVLQARANTAQSS